MMISPAPSPAEAMECSFATRGLVSTTYKAHVSLWLGRFLGCVSPCEANDMPGQMTCFNRQRLRSHNEDTGVQDQNVQSDSQRGMDD